MPGDNRRRGATAVFRERGQRAEAAIAMDCSQDARGPGDARASDGAGGINSSSSARGRAMVNVEPRLDCVIERCDGMASGGAAGGANDTLG